MLWLLGGTFFVSAAVACGLTGLVRAYALRQGMLDVPNERSSHTRATPRGGGLAIAAALLAGTAWLAAAGYLALPLAWALGGGGLLVAMIGWLDDRYRLRPGLRAAVHFMAAGWALYWLGGFPSLELGSWTLTLGWAGSLLAMIGIAWMINLYNFMDGIDGLAAGEALVVGGAAGLLLALDGLDGLAALSFLVAGSAAGFLVWNWPPAKIFMGDVSSGLLGYVFGVLAIASERSGSLPVMLWVLMLGVFVVDATATLARRALRGERLREAHRTHAYQLAVQAGYSHRRVAAAALAATMFLCLLAALAWRKPDLMILLFGGGIAILLWIWRQCIFFTSPAQTRLHDLDPGEPRRGNWTA